MQSMVMQEMSGEGRRESLPSVSLPATSLIMCSRNRPKLLLDSVVSVLRGECTPAELIIIDQSDARHTTLSTLGPTRGCDVRYVWTTSRGLSCANNLGIELARHERLVFTHDDVKVTPSWFASIVQALVDAGPRAVVMGQVPATEPERSGGFVPTKKLGAVSAVYEGRVGQDVLCPINMAMYRAVIDEVGCFDERLGPGAFFSSAEDNDFGFRVLEADYRIVYVPRAIIFHRAWRGANDYIPLKWAYGRGQGAFYAKHLSLRDSYILRRMLGDIWRHTRRLPMRVWWRDRTKGIGDMVYTLALLTGAIEWLITQRKAP